MSVATARPAFARRTRVLLEAAGLLALGLVNALALAGGACSGARA